MTTYKSGGDVDTFCNRCQLELAHIIVAVAAGRPVRVICKTCKTEHAWRGPKGKTASKPKVAGSAAPRTRGAGAAAATYEEIMQGKDVARAARYAVATRFAQDDVLDHKTFGLGVVIRVMADDKIEVVFREGTKVLAHARA